MFSGKRDQFLKDIIALAGAWVAEDLSSGHHLVGDPAESSGDFDADVARVLALEPPSRQPGPGSAHYT